jgi:hypothetical protein
MSVIMQTWCQIQRTSYGLRYVNCGPGHIQCIYSSAYSVVNILLTVSALLFEIYRYLHARYTAWCKYRAHPPVYAMWMLVRQYTMYFQHRIFRLQYSAVGICAAIVHITTIQCALYCILGAKYSAHPPVYAMRPVVPDINKVFTAPHIQSWIFDWTYLRCCLIYADICMLVILQIWCQIQNTSSGLRYVNCGTDYIQSIFSTAYLGFNIQL